MRSIREAIAAKSSRDRRSDRTWTFQHNAFIRFGAVFLMNKFRGHEAQRSDFRSATRSQAASENSLFRVLDSAVASVNGMDITIRSGPGFESSGIECGEYDDQGHFG
jgi:hypothetical protein